jgi:hypothetical protein
VRDVHHVAGGSEAGDVVAVFCKSSRAWDTSEVGRVGETYVEMGSSSLSMMTRTSRESTSVRDREAMVAIGLRLEVSKAFEEEVKKAVYGYL